MQTSTRHDGIAPSPSAHPSHGLLGHVQLVSGRHFNVLAPDPAAIKVADIAHGLAMQCRFNGQTSEFYSVADHSVRVAELMLRRHADARLALWGLLHDASEAYVGDVVRPVKRQLGAFVAIEEKVQQAVARAFGLPWPMPAEVHDADNALLAVEARHLMGRSPSWSEPPADALAFTPPRSPKEGKEAFLAAFGRLAAATA